jgi:methylthioribose-1-phosphate isomerase
VTQNIAIITLTPDIIKMTSALSATVHALQWTGTHLAVLDQRLLPEQLIYTNYNDAIGVTDAITTMQVRGAPAIGIAASYGVALSVIQHYLQNPMQWQQKVKEDIALLARSRPTAVNLFWALEQMTALLAQPLNDPIKATILLAEKIHSDDIAANLTMGELGADLLTGAKGLMTHCNAGALATGGYGTALGVIRSICQRQTISIYMGETRPWLQGARLTAWEFAQEGIPATLIADSAAAWLMKSGAIDWIVVGADRITARGDVANKIGTYSLAVLAKQHGVKVMVVAPTSTIDWSIENGGDIAIEQRPAHELLPNYYQQEGSLINAWNPVFDVTPAELITAIVTERGVVMNPTLLGLQGIKNEIL